MAIMVADNFSYLGRKPMDGRLTCDTISAMTSMAESVVYDGIIVYNKETEKYYTFKSINPVDATLQKWRELNVGSGSSSIEEYGQGKEIKAKTLIVYQNKLYVATKDFTADGTAANDDASFLVDIAAGNLIPIANDDTHSFQYVVGNEYKANNLVVKNDKVYLVLKDFTATNFDTELTNKDIIAVDSELDTHSVAYIQDADYKKGNLLVFEDRLYITLVDFTSDSTETAIEDSFAADLAANKMKEVCIDIDTNCSEYKQNTPFKKNTLVFNGTIIARVAADYTSDATAANVNDAFDADITAGNLILMTSGADDAVLSDAVTANLAVGNIKAGDAFAVGTTFTDFVKKLLIKEILPVAVLSAQDSGLRLKGTTVAAPEISATLTKGSGTIQKVEFYRNATMENTQNYVDGTSVYKYNTTDITTDTTVTVKLYYIESDGTTTGILSYSKNYKFMNNSYVGVLGNVPTAADIPTLSTNLKDVKGFTVTVSPNDQHIVYAYPSSLGALASIKDQNNFEYIQSYTHKTESVNGEAYNVYYLTDKVTALGIKQIYS